MSASLAANRARRGSTPLLDLSEPSEGPLGGGLLVEVDTYLSILVVAQAAP